MYYITSLKSDLFYTKNTFQWVLYTIFSTTTEHYLKKKNLFFIIKIFIYWFLESVKPRLKEKGFMKWRLVEKEM